MTKPSSNRVLEYVILHPGCTYKQVARDTGMSERVVRRALDKLAQEGKLIATDDY